MPRRTHAPNRRRQSARWAPRTALPTRHDCGCKTDGTWKCQQHFAEYRTAKRAAATEGEFT